MSDQLLINERAAAAMLSICPRTLLTYRQKGLIPAIKIGKRGFRYSVDDLRAFVASQRASARPNMAEGAGVCLEPK